MAEEDEWIYKFPEFLSSSTFHLAHLGDDFDNYIGTGSNSQISRNANYETARSAHSGTIQHAMRESLCQCAEQPPWTLIADAKKHKLYGQPRAVDPAPWLAAPWKLHGPETLGGTLRKPRTARDAKKRFIWLPQAVCNTLGMELCQRATVSESENQAISHFLRRHLKFETQCSDHTNTVLNTWQTELNLSFHVIIPTSTDLEESGQGKTFQNRFIEAPNINRVSMGYRFDGDMFNRYWTCHFVESERRTRANPCVHSMPSPEDLESVFESYTEGKEQFKQWWERKILELLLAHRMLRKQIVEGKKTIDRVTQIVEKFETSGPSVGTKYEVKITAAGIWELGKNCKDRLQQVADDIKSTSETMEEWNLRE